MKAIICCAVSWCLAAMCAGAYFAAAKYEDEAAIVAVMRQQWFANSAVIFAASGLICLSMSDASASESSARKTRAPAKVEDAPEWLK